MRFAQILFVIRSMSRINRVYLEQAITKISIDKHLNLDKIFYENKFCIDKNSNNKSSLNLSRLGLIISLVIFFFLFPHTLFAQQAGITSPATGASVSGSVPILGTAVIEPFQKYELHYKLEPNGDDAYIYFDGGTNQITSGQLGVLQAGAFAPGTYSIRLRVVKLDGNYAEYFAQNLSVNQAPPTAVVVAPTATLPTVGSIGAVVTPTPTFTPPPSVPTLTPIPTLTFTPAPQPTPAVGQVTQPQVQTNILPTRTPLPTSTPVEVAAIIDAPDLNSDSSGGAEVIVSNADAAGNSASDSASDSVSDSALGNESSVVAEVAGGAQSASGSSSSLTRQLGETLAFNRLQRYFFTGMRYSATIALLITLLFAGKRLFRWVRSQV